jgi:hypothetical protein
LWFFQADGASKKAFKEDVLEELLDQFDSFLCDIRTKVTVMINEQLLSPSKAINHIKND